MNISAKKISAFQIIILGFMGLIVAGTILLLLPVSVKSGNNATIEDALFTATSAVCVTGLAVKDTASFWSTFGQAVILILIQIGGLGIISVATFIAIISGKKISLFQRSMIQESISAQKIGGLVKMIGFIFKISLIIEAIGTVLMLPTFCRDYGFLGIWMSVFHSISAFCNAGFDIMGEKTGEFSSLASYVVDPGIIIPVCLLIIVGGIGFLTWEDIAVNKIHFHKYRMQSKVVLVTTVVLLIIPMLYFLFIEYTEGPVNERILISIFQAVTPRTAGFSTVSLSALSESGYVLFIILMLIGGSPGSTAGGMKTTTAAVIASNIISVFKRKNSVEMFGRRIEDSTVRIAATLFSMYLILSVVCATIISMVEGLPLKNCLFETASAVGTVGVSLGITPALSLPSHLILIVLMFLGRVGGLTLIYATINEKNVNISERPVEKINVG